MKKEGYSLRKRILYGFLSVCLVSIGGAFVLSYFFLRDNAITQSKTDQQKKVEGLMVALDYAVSHTSVETKDLKEILGNRIYEITDVNKLDAVVYDLQGNYILSNKDIPNAEQKLPIHLIAKVLGGNTRVDITTYAEDIDANLISSYLLLKNNELEPIGIVYVPYYHNDSVYFGVFKTYINHIIIINIIVILIAAFLSWVISKNLTKHLQEFSKLIDNLTLFEKNLKPIRHYENDELSVLAKSYNRLVYQILDQKEKLSFAEKEKAWQEMAKQVAHEVKNPLTPMKLTIQNFKRKFSVTDPDAVEKVNKMADSVVEQIDTIASVAMAFSQYAQLPEKNDEIFNLKNEVENIVRIFDDGDIFTHFNKDEIAIKMDRIYLNRILTNLITNAKQATDATRKLIINIDVEQIYKKITIKVQDNGTGISDEIKERIFEPNFTSKSSGSGLGLTMVRKMIEDYKGEIVLNTELGKGTTFIITLTTNL